MSEISYVFPFEFITKGSNVLIYGLGGYGHRYIRQIEETGWCGIVGVSDRDSSKNDTTYPYVAPEVISQARGYDYVILALAHMNPAREVLRMLCVQGVPENKVLSPFLRDGKIETDDLGNYDLTRPLSMLFLMRGGMGDGVQELALYEKLVSLVPEIEIDIYGEEYFRYYYDTKKNIRNIYNYNDEEPKFENYDVVLEAGWGIQVYAYKEERLSRLAPELHQLIVESEKRMREACSTEIRIRRAQILKKNKLWLMGREGLWGLSSEDIHVDLKPEYKEKYESLHLKNYITVNCGADMRRIKEEWQFPSKIWPISYFEKIIPMIKKKLPGVEVVQLGAEKQEMIRGADRYLLGLSMETVKYIVRDSLLHIDDEGGLVHLATALGTKCVVLFGPTPMDILGYPKNINICANVCPGCFSAVENWNTYCYRGLHEPPCMYSITPEMVMNRVIEYFENEGIDKKPQTGEMSI